MIKEDMVQELKERILKDRIITKLSSSELRRLEENWWLQKFMDIAKNDVDVAYTILSECLKWRHTMEIEYISILSLKPLLEKQLMYIRGKDRNDCSLLWIHWSQFNPDESLTETLFIFWMEKQSITTSGAPLTMMLDMSQTKPKHMDIKLFKLILHCTKYYYPNTVLQILVYESPSFFSAAWKVIQSYASEGYPDIVHVNNDSVKMFVDRNCLKPYQGGEDEFIFTMDKLLDYLPEPQNLPEKPFMDEDFGNANGKRSVTFDDMNIGRNQPLTLTRRPSKGPGKRSSTPSNIRQLMELRIKNKEQSWFRSKCIAVSPKEELSLAKMDGEADFIDIVVIKNDSTSSLLYKIKTTSPEKFRVRPSTGVVDPGATEYIRVYLQKEYEHSCTKEKFLLMALLTSEKDLDNFGEIWKTCNDEQKIEHKLKCRLTATDTTDKRPERKSSLLSNQQDAIEQLQSTTERLVSAQRWIILVLALITVSQMFLMIKLLGINDSNNANSQNIIAEDISVPRDDL